MNDDSKISFTGADNNEDKILDLCSHKDKERVAKERFGINTALRENVYSPKDLSCLKCMNCICQKNERQEFSCIKCDYFKICLKPESCLLIMMKLPKDRSMTSRADVFDENNYICQSCHKRSGCYTSN